MRYFFGSMPSALLAAAFLLCLGASAPAPAGETLLHTFTWNADGGFPWDGVAPDGKGNLFGTAYFGGATGGVCCGTVFELTPAQKHGWDYRIIYTFPDGGLIHGEAPSAGLIADAVGNLYGTAQEGGDLIGCGIVFELSPTMKGPWKQTILHRFNKPDKIDGDGCTPVSWVAFDRAGNLYGTTEYGGGHNYNNECNQNAPGCGSIFELSTEGNGKWKESVIHRFPDGQTDGLFPYGGLVVDQAGNLWGTTEETVTANGPNPGGTVFELSPDAKGKWKEASLFQFTGNSTGTEPMDGLTIDPAGNLYGTTYRGGSGNGLVFELTPQAKGPPVETVLYAFQPCTAERCPDGGFPWGGLAFDTAGNLYGTTSVGGGKGTACDSSGGQQVGCGVIFKLAPAGQGAWNYSIVHKFPGAATGEFPTDDRLYVTSDGTIYGTTFDGGDQDAGCPQEVLGLSGCGVVFELKP